MAEVVFSGGKRGGKGHDPTRIIFTIAKGNRVEHGRQQKQPMKQCPHPVINIITGHIKTPATITTKINVSIKYRPIVD